MIFLPTSPMWEIVDRCVKMITLSHMKGTDRERLVDLAAKQTFLTAGKVSEEGIHSHQLTRLVADGILERIARGHYRFANADVTEHHGLARVAAAAPSAVICLLSALSFHEIGTQLPAEVWIAIERGSRTPRIPYPRLRVVRFSGAAFHEGIERHVVEGAEIRVYSAAKTVADCFKYRNKIGIDVAVEALQDFSRSHRGGATELARFALICRVSRVMQPYLDAIP